MSDTTVDPNATPPEQPALPLNTPEPAPVAEATPAPTEEPKPHPNAGKPAWWQTKLNEAGEERARLQRELETERRARQDAEQLASRVTQPTEQRRPTQTPADDHQRRNEIMAEAARLRFQEDIASVRSKGFGQYGQDFNTTINTLTQVGVDNDFLADALSVAQSRNIPAHVLLTNLAKDPEKTIGLTGLQSRQRVAEMIDLVMAENKPAPQAQSSKAPPPPPRLDPVSEGRSDSMGDDVGDDEWSRAWNNKYKPRKSA